jgi:hypothetical protein
VADGRLARPGRADLALLVGRVMPMALQLTCRPIDYGCVTRPAVGRANGWGWRWASL